MTKKLTLILTIVFFAGLLLLTIFARQIHNASLPKVTTERVPQEMFPFEYVLDDGTKIAGSQQAIAVPKALYDSGEIYVVYFAEKNGEKRDFVRKTFVTVGAENDGYYEVLSGLNFSDKLVTDCEGELYDGCEVNVVS